MVSICKSDLRKAFGADAVELSPESYAKLVATYGEWDRESINEFLRNKNLYDRNADGEFYQLGALDDLEKIVESRLIKPYTTPRGRTFPNFLAYARHQGMSEHEAFSDIVESVVREIRFGYLNSTLSEIPIDWDALKIALNRNEYNIMSILDTNIPEMEGYRDELDTDGDWTVRCSADRLRKARFINDMLRYATVGKSDETSMSTLFAKSVSLDYYKAMCKSNPEVMKSRDALVKYVSDLIKADIVALDDVLPKKGEINQGAESQKDKIDVEAITEAVCDEVEEDKEDYESEDLEKWPLGSTWEWNIADHHMHPREKDGTFRYNRSREGQHGSGRVRGVCHHGPNSGKTRSAHSKEWHMSVNDRNRTRKSVSETLKARYENEDFDDLLAKKRGY